MSAWTDRIHNFQHRNAPYLFVAPFVVLFCTFGLYPLVKSVVLSFYATSGPNSQLFVGLDNFRFLIHDPDFRQAVLNTVIFAACSVFLQLPLSLGLALLVNHRLLRGRNYFRLCFFSPNLVGMVFVGVLFGVIFLAHYGLLTVGLHKLFGLSTERGWLDDPKRIMPALVLTSLWMYVGFNMVYFLAALQGVDQTLYEAATVDGANAFQRFWHVTVPGIKPVAVFVVILSTIGSFQLFELPYLMLNNGPGAGNAGLTIVMYLYQNGFVTGDLGYASAIGWTLVLGVLAVAVFQMVLSGSWKKEA